MFISLVRRRRFMRYSLRTLFVGMTVVAVAMTWLLAQRRWIDERRETREWATSNSRVSLAQSSSRERLPFGLRILGESAIEYFQLNAAYLSESEGYRIQQLRELFPEAEVRVIWKPVRPTTLRDEIQHWMTSCATEFKFRTLTLCHDLEDAIGACAAAVERIFLLLRNVSATLEQQNREL